MQFSKKLFLGRDWEMLSLDKGVESSWIEADTHFSIGFPDDGYWVNPISRFGNFGDYVLLFHLIEFAFDGIFQSDGNFSRGCYVGGCHFVKGYFVLAW